MPYLFKEGAAGYDDRMERFMKHRTTLRIEDQLDTCKDNCSLTWDLEVGKIKSLNLGWWDSIKKRAQQKSLWRDTTLVECKNKCLDHFYRRYIEIHNVPYKYHFFNVDLRDEKTKQLHDKYGTRRLDSEGTPVDPKPLIIYS